MDSTQLKSLIEAIIFASPEPLSPADLRDLMSPSPSPPPVEGGGKKIFPSPLVGEVSPKGAPSGGEGGIDPADQLKKAQEQLAEEISISDIKKCLGELMEEYLSLERGFELVEVAKGYQFRTKSVHAPYLRALSKAPKTRLSAPGMETLAILAYQQPIIRAKIEEIRGVDSGGVLKTLLDRDLARIVGRSVEPGRPILYGTSQTFLETFGLNALSDLPTLKDLENIQSAQGGVFSDDEEEKIEEESPLEGMFDDVAAPVDEESAGLVTELENSMRSLKDLEEKIFQKEEDDLSSPEYQKTQ